jgi:hypothetical protein
VEVQRQALEKIEACRYCDSVRVRQDSLIDAQAKQIIEGDSARVNAERRATARGIEAASLQKAVDADVVILGAEKKRGRFWKWTAIVLGAYVIGKEAKEILD